MSMQGVEAIRVRRAGVRWLVAVLGTVVVGSLVLTAAVDASVSGLARLLLARDPGVRDGAETLVGIGAGQVLRGVGDRPNFIVALRSRETVVSGAEGDELGAVAERDTIVA